MTNQTDKMFEGEMSSVDEYSELMVLAGYISRAFVLGKEVMHIDLVKVGCGCTRLLLSGIDGHEDSMLTGISSMGLANMIMHQMPMISATPDAASRAVRMGMTLNTIGGVLALRMINEHNHDPLSAEDLAVLDAMSKYTENGGITEVEAAEVGNKTPEEMAKEMVDKLLSGVRSKASNRMQSVLLKKGESDAAALKASVDSYITKLEMAKDGGGARHTAHFASTLVEAMSSGGKPLGIIIGFVNEDDSYSMDAVDWDRVKGIAIGMSRMARDPDLLLVSEFKGCHSLITEGEALVVDMGKYTADMSNILMIARSITQAVDGGKPATKRDFDKAVADVMNNNSKSVLAINERGVMNRMGSEAEAAQPKPPKGSTLH